MKNMECLGIYSSHGIVPFLRHRFLPAAPKHPQTHRSDGSLATQSMSPPVDIGGVSAVKSRLPQKNGEHGELYGDIVVSSGVF